MGWACCAVPGQDVHDELNEEHSAVIAALHGLPPHDHIADLLLDVHLQQADSNDNAMKPTQSAVLSKLKTERGCSHHVHGHVEVVHKCNGLDEAHNLPQRIPATCAPRRTVSTRCPTQ